MARTIYDDDVYASRSDGHCFDNDLYTSPPPGYTFPDDALNGMARWIEIMNISIAALEAATSEDDHDSDDEFHSYAHEHAETRRSCQLALSLMLKHNAGEIDLSGSTWEPENQIVGEYMYNLRLRLDPGSEWNRSLEQQENMVIALGAMAGEEAMKQIAERPEGVVALATRGMRFTQ